MRARNPRPTNARLRLWQRIGIAAASARELFNLVSTDRTRLLDDDSVSALRLFKLLPRHPIVTVASVMNLLGTSKPTAARAIEVLAEIGILLETTGRKRDRSFAYRAYMERLRIGTDLDLGH